MGPLKVSEILNLLGDETAMDDWKKELQEVGRDLTVD